MVDDYDYKMWEKFLSKINIFVLIFSHFTTTLNTLEQYYSVYSTQYEKMPVDNLKCRFINKSRISILFQYQFRVVIRIIF